MDSFFFISLGLSHDTLVCGVLLCHVPFRSDIDVALSTAKYIQGFHVGTLRELYARTSRMYLL